MSEKLTSWLEQLGSNILCDHSSSRLVLTKIEADRMTFFWNALSYLGEYRRHMFWGRTWETFNGMEEIQTGSMKGYDSSIFRAYAPGKSRSLPYLQGLSFSFNIAKPVEWY